MEENDLFKTSVGRLVVYYKNINGRPQLWRVKLDSIRVKLDPLEIQYERELKEAKRAACRYFRQKQPKKAR